MWGIAGIVLAFLCLVSLYRLYSQEGLNPVLEQITNHYRYVAHNLFDLAFFWWSYEFPIWAKDLLAFNLVIGAGVANGWLEWVDNDQAMHRQLDLELSEELGEDPKPELTPIRSFLKRLNHIQMRVVITTFGWPLMLLFVSIVFYSRKKFPDALKEWVEEHIEEYGTPPDEEGIAVFREGYMELGNEITGSVLTNLVVVPLATALIIILTS